MLKTILLTGSTDGIGLETAKKLATGGHTLLVHGRNPKKLDAALGEISAIPDAGPAEAFIADLTDFSDVAALADNICETYDRLDVVINNAGVLKTAEPVGDNGLDVRFVVNTIAPYLLTQRLTALMDATGRVVNVSSAAQAPVSPDALAGHVRLTDMDAYAQSKLAITMWTNALARTRSDGPIFVAVNPGSLLASKMVREGYGIAGNDLGIGADILVRAALSSDFADANGKYFDNDSGRFAAPHADALDPRKCDEIVHAVEKVLSDST